ncbi:MAG: peptide-methionine (S)-S-oxide reductase [Pseudomonadota bacterium]
MMTVGFGGGCHWCTEAVFQAVRGVREVRQGFIRAASPHDSYSEAVDVSFDAAVVPFDALIRVHLATHASTSAHSMRGKYRSAVYTRDAEMAELARQAIRSAETENDASFVTLVLPHCGFKSSDAQFHNYRATGPERPFCKTYIDPKLARLRREFAHLMTESPADI